MITPNLPMNPNQIHFFSKDTFRVVPLTNTMFFLTRYLGQLARTSTNFVALNLTIGQTPQLP